MTATGRATLVGVGGYVLALTAMWLGIAQAVGNSIGPDSVPSPLAYGVPALGLAVFHFALSLMSHRPPIAVLWGGGLLALYGSTMVMTFLTDRGLLPQGAGIFVLLTIWLILAVYAARASAPPDA